MHPIYCQVHCYQKYAQSTLQVEGVHIRPVLNHKMTQAVFAEMVLTDNSLAWVADMSHGARVGLLESC